MKSLLLHPHLPTREALRDLLIRLGHIVVYEDGVASMPKTTEDAVRYQAQFIVAEEPEPHVRQRIELDFDQRLPDVPIVWLPDDYWQEPREQWLIDEIAEVTSFI